MRNCPRCLRDFDGAAESRICGACRKPRVRGPRPVSKDLTRRETQLVDLVATGKLNKEIAHELHLSEGTIKTYLSAVFLKLGVTNRTELAVFVITQRMAAQ